MAQLPNVYSLLGQATTDEYRRRRREDRKYREDLERDRLKASLLGMVLNPVIGSVTQGISGAIANKFSGRLEDFQRLETVREIKKDFDKGYEEQQVINKKYYAPWQESGKTLEAYYNEDVLPDRLEEELQTALSESSRFAPNTTLDDIFGPNKQNKRRFINNLIATNPELQKQKQEDFKNFQEIMNIYPNLEDKSAYEARLLPQLKKSIGADGWLPALGRKLFKGDSDQELIASSLKILEQDDLIAQTRAGKLAKERYRKSGVFDQTLFNEALEQKEELEKYLQVPDVARATEIVRDEQGNVVGRQETVIKQYPFLVKENGGDFTSKITTVDEVDDIQTPASRKRTFAKALRRKSNWKPWYDSLTKEGRDKLLTAFEKLGDKSLTLEKVNAAAMANWANFTDDQIIKSYEILSSTLTTDETGLFTEESIAEKYRASFGQPRLTAQSKEIALLEKQYNNALKQLKVDNPGVSEANLIEMLKENKSLYRPETVNAAGQIVPGDFFFNIARADYIKALDEYIENINNFARDLESRGY